MLVDPLFVGRLTQFTSTSERQGIMTIDKAISYSEIERNGDKVRRKNIAYKPNTASNGYDYYPNVIPIGPIPHEKPWWEETPIKEEDESRKKRPERRYASHNSEALAMEYWFDRWQEHELRDQFKSLKSFISWSLANEDQPFSRGGIVSLRN